MVGMGGNKLFTGDDHGGNAALHVRSATPEQVIIPDNRVEGITVPFLRGSGRYHIGVTCKYEQGCPGAAPGPQVVNHAKAKVLVYEAGLFQASGNQFLAAAIIRCYRGSPDKVLCKFECLAHDGGLLKQVGVGSFTEAEMQTVAEIKHGSLDHGRLFQHKLYCSAPVKIAANGFRQLAPGCTTAIQQVFPPQGLYPAFQKQSGKSVSTYIVKPVFHGMPVQPATRFSDRVAVPDAEDCHHAGQISRNSSLMPTLERVFSSTRFTMTAQ